MVQNSCLRGGEFNKRKKSSSQDELSLVQRKDVVESLLPELGDAEREHRQQDEHGCQVQALATSSGEHDGPIAFVLLSIL